MNTLQLEIQGRTFNANVLEDEGRKWVAITPICNAVGVESAKQAAKLKRNPQFNPRHMVGGSQDGKQRDMLCIPLEEVAMWLCGINANKVRPEIRDALISFQKWCQLKLFEAMSSDSSAKEVADLKELVLALSQTVTSLTQTVTGLGTKVNGVVGTLDSWQEIEATNAGKQLAARRHLKIV